MTTDLGSAAPWTSPVGASAPWMLMEHKTREGHPRLLHRCPYPLTGVGEVRPIYTNLAVLDDTPDGLAGARGNGAGHGPRGIAGGDRSAAGRLGQAKRPRRKPSAGSGFQPFGRSARFTGATL